MGKNKNTTANNSKNNTTAKTMKEGKNMKKTTIPYKATEGASVIAKAIHDSKCANFDVSKMNDIMRHALIDFTCKSDKCGELAKEVQTKTEAVRKEYEAVLKKHKDTPEAMTAEEKQEYAIYLVKIDDITNEYKKPKQEANSAKKKALKNILGENSAVVVTDKHNTTYTLYSAYTHYISNDCAKAGIFKDAIKSFLLKTGIVSETDSYATGAYKKFMDNFLQAFGMKSASDKEKYEGSARCKAMSQSAFNELFVDRFIDITTALENIDKQEA